MSAIGVWLVLGLSGPASATTCDPQAAWASLRAYDSGARDAYLCLAGHPDGAAILTAALDAEPAVPSEAGPSDAGGDPSPLTPEDAARLAGELGRPAAVHVRTTRCLGLWLLERGDTAWDPSLVRRLSADDRRLLADGVYARRGRRSPSPDHDQIFRQFTWYQPDPRYTDNRLTDIDRANLSLADRPPAAPPPAAAPEVQPAAAEPPGCGGCRTAPASGWGGLGLAGLLLRRRKGTGGETPSIRVSESPTSAHKAACASPS